MVVQNFDEREVAPEDPAGRAAELSRNESQVFHDPHERTERQALLVIALLLVVIKSIQFAMDSQALFFSDSSSYMTNALRLGFSAFRSYVYGEMIHAFALPFHSLRAIVAMQIIVGGCTAWLLAFALVRFLTVRPWIAILAAVVFAFDPVQIVHEHMVMTETAALLAMAVYLVTTLEFIRTKSLHWLVVLAFVGILLVSLRTVYLPVVLATAVIVPLVAWVAFPPARLRILAVALMVSCLSTIVFHLGYRKLTGRLARREPIYTENSGSFLLVSTIPILEPGDARDSRISDAIVAQSKSRFPLGREHRWVQLWSTDGLVARIRMILDNDGRAVDQAARSAALAAIRRDPLGYVGIAAQNWLDYWRKLPSVRSQLTTEDGMKSPQLQRRETGAIQVAFGVDVSNNYRLDTPSRRYHLLAANWNIFLLLAPFLSGLALWLSPANRRGTAFLLLWSLLLLTATCFSESETIFRYLHPFSFTALAATAILCEQLARKFFFSTEGKKGT